MVFNSLYEIRFTKRSWRFPLFYSFNSLCEIRSIWPSDSIRFKVCSFNSLYEILAYFYFPAKVLYISFNSLYEIQEFVKIYESDLKKLAFQFSLWDSSRKTILTFTKLLNCFQFSLWDSCSFLWSRFRRCFMAFNSLYEILEGLRLWIDPKTTKTFNSLYEIHEKENFTFAWGKCNYLSILFMRFTPLTIRIHTNNCKLFQFSLWDSWALVLYRKI